MNQETTDRITGLLQNYISEATNYVDSNIAPDRTKSYSYYYGEQPYPKKGQPPIVKKVIFEKIQAALAQIKEPFVSGRDVIKFIPFNTTDGYGANIASAVVNKILKTDNDLDSMYTDLILDGLLAKSGILKVTWSEEEETNEESFSNLSLDSLSALLEQDDVELVESEINEPQFNLDQLLNLISPTQLASLYPQGVEVLRSKVTDWSSLIKEVPSMESQINSIKESATTYSGTISRTIERSSVKFKTVTPENFIINEEATSVDNSTFCAERNRVRVSELYDMGYDAKLIEELSEKGQSQYGDLGQVGQSRNSFDNTQTNSFDGSIEPANKYVDLYECYVETALFEHDYDKSLGKPAKLYQVCIANDIILHYTEVDKRPFFTWCPLIVPHKMFGQSMAETLFEQQDTATAALRGAIQYLAFSTNPRYKAINPGSNDSAHYDLASFQANMPGSVVAVKSGDLIPFAYPQLDQSIFQILGTVNDDASSVSGVSDMSTGLDNNILRSNVAGSTVAMAMDASGRRIKEYARNLANQCIKPAFCYAYELFRKNAEDDIVVTIDGKDVNVNPKSLPIRTNLDIDYALGRNDQMEVAQSLLSMKQRIDADPMLKKMQTPLMAHQLEVDIMKASGIYDPSRYLIDPKSAPIQPSDLEKQQLAMQQEQLKQQQIAMQIQQEQLAIERSKLELEVIKVRQQMELDRMKFEHQVLLDTFNGKLSKDKLEFQQEVAADELDLKEKSLQVDTLRTTAEIKLEHDQQRGVDLN